MLTTIILELSTKKRLKSKIFENSHDQKINMKLDHFTLFLPAPLTLQTAITRVALECGLGTQYLPNNDELSH